MPNASGEHLNNEFAFTRLTPGHNYLESLAMGNVDVEAEQILKVDATGIETISGRKYEVDCIVCATGFDTSYKPAFPLIGLAGTDLRDEWKEEPRSYLSVAASGFPNYFSKSSQLFCAES